MDFFLKVADPLKTIAFYSCFISIEKGSAWKLIICYSSVKISFKSVFFS